jgi:acyl-CoA reductase-like NAD-dependent aldehyde dehydrogenase
MTDTSTDLAGPLATPIENTVDQLRATFDSGRTRSYQWRSDQLRSLGALLTEGEGALVDALVEDLRRTPFEAVLFDIAPTKGELKHTIRNLRHWMQPRNVRTPIGGRPGRAWYQYEPLGVTMIISPWNYRSSSSAQTARIRFSSIATRLVVKARDTSRRNMVCLGGSRAMIRPVSVIGSRDIDSRVVPWLELYVSTSLWACSMS